MEQEYFYFDREEQRAIIDVQKAYEDSGRSIFKLQEIIQNCFGKINELGYAEGFSTYDTIAAYIHFDCFDVDDVEVINHLYRTQAYSENIINVFPEYIRIDLVNFRTLLRPDNGVDTLKSLIQPYLEEDEDTKLLIDFNSVIIPHIGVVEEFKRLFPEILCINLKPLSEIDLKRQEIYSKTILPTINNLDIARNYYKSTFYLNKPYLAYDTKEIFIFVITDIGEKLSGNKFIIKRKNTIEETIMQRKQIKFNDILQGDFVLTELPEQDLAHFLRVKNPQQEIGEPILQEELEKIIHIYVRNYCLSTHEDGVRLGKLIKARVHNKDLTARVDFSNIGSLSSQFLMGFIVGIKSLKQVKIVNMDTQTQETLECVKQILKQRVKIKSLELAISKGE